MLCSAGSGTFEAEFLYTGITVRVGASRNGELATRSCAASLGWDKNTVPVVTNAAQVDLDAFGADLGLREPVAAFQARKAADDCCVEYQVYSLTKPPRLLRTIAGGGFFRAADTDLDGQVEIWTDDASAVDGFEDLTLDEFDSPPTLVLRFIGGKLIDVSSEFQLYFDDEIAKLRGELAQSDVDDFKASDGKLPIGGAVTAERMHRLRQTKIKVLEIVWCYLYSGREAEAWHALADLWPSADVPRIRAAILRTRAQGISTQLDGVVQAVSGKRKKKQVRIFDAVTEWPEGLTQLFLPKPIMLHRPISPGTPATAESHSETTLILVIDSAGKVRSAEPGGKGAVDTALIRATAGWKFIPAFANGHPLTCRTRFAVSPMQ